MKTRNTMSAFLLLVALIASSCAILTVPVFEEEEEEIVEKMEYRTPAQDLRDE